MEEYKEGARVQFTVDGNVSHLHTGTVRGKAYVYIITHWIVVCDEYLDGWPYSAVIIQDSFIRRLGDNRPFGCEGQ